MVMRTSLYAALVVGACLVLANCGQSSETASTASQTMAPAESSTASTTPHVGDCSDTTVTAIGPRLEGVPGSGSSIQYANGLSQVEYDAVPGIDHSRAGDQVHVCLVSIPENCPAGDERGRIYSATNARTGETWSAPNAEHSCGGA